MFSKIPAYFLRFLILCYRFIFSVSAGRQCRFEPTCSHYASEALKNHTFTKALWLVIKRIWKCSPFSRYQNDWYCDPVPPVFCGDDDTKKHLK
jgi:putative membrane protein insertion efficiency factor